MNVGIRVNGTFLKTVVSVLKASSLNVGIGLNRVAPCLYSLETCGLMLWVGDLYRPSVGSNKLPEMLTMLPFI